MHAIDPSRLDLAAEFRDNPLGPHGPELQHLLKYAEKLTRAPATVSQADIDTLRGQGIPEQMIEDTVNVVALFGYMNRLVDAFGVEGAPDYFRMVGAALAKNGYAKLLPRQAA